MKKLFVLLAVIAASVSAASAQGWGIGGRLGNGIQAVGHRYFANDNYLEARLGLYGWSGTGVGADISVLHVWNTFNWDWTPGNWFLDFGAGANLNINKYYLGVGAQGMAKFGYTFENIPLTLAVDYSLMVGPFIGLEKGLKTRFDWIGDNYGLSAIYRF